MKKIALIALATLLSACSALSTKSVSGTFTGTLPCADCEKIEAELVLNSDNSYEYHTVYFKKGKEFPFSEKGKFVWDKNKENVIHLENSGGLVLQINDTHAEFCGPDGNTIKGKSDYRLTKVATTAK